ncbi:MAG: hypothetical protein V4581_10565 [Bacteroidota bacterium]
MKKNLLSATALFAFATITAQTTIYNGDGTLSTNRIVTMAAKNLTFQPSSTVGAGGLFINGTTGSVAFTKSSTASTFATGVIRNKECLVFSAGKLLDGEQDARLFNFYDFPFSNQNTNGATVWVDIEDRGYITRQNFWATQGKDSKFTLFDKTQAETFGVYDDGNSNVNLTMPKANSHVCIGTTSYNDGTDTYALSVKGNVRANRVKVYTTWADYVFEDNYELPTLNEVETYINENGHLKDIPSAAEVEAKGIELGEMNKLLLQKVEELTLYMIEQNKVNAQQAQQIEELKVQVKNLSEKK